MNILHSQNGETSLLFSACRRRPPSLEVMRECASAIAKADALSNSKISPRSEDVIRIDKRGLLKCVSSCEPSRFLLLRDLTAKIKRDCERYTDPTLPLTPVKSAHVRLSASCSPTELLAYGICAKCCGVSELYFSMPKEAFENEHALAARLCDAHELILCSDTDCVIDAAFGIEGVSYFDGRKAEPHARAKLLIGSGGEAFSTAAGLVSSFMNVKVKKEITGEGMVFCAPYDVEVILADIKRSLSQRSTRQLLLICANEKAALSIMNEIGGDGRVTLLLTSSDAESIAAARKLDALRIHTYGAEGTVPCSADKNPPLMNEALSPCAFFGIDPHDFFMPEFDGSSESVEEFAQLLAKHVGKGLSPEDTDTVAVRLKKL